MEKVRFGVNMLHKECAYFPCHKGLEDCKYCYCPIYPCGYEEYGRFIIGKEKEKIWDCSDCVVFHKSKITDLIKLNGQFKKEQENGS